MTSDRIRIVEVGPRDGLQNEKGTVPTDAKVAFVDALSDAGYDEIEVSSFVSPKWVPQLADAEEVFRRIRRRPEVRYTALVPNVQGLERAVVAGADKVAVFTAASETFSRKNTNASIAETIQRFAPVLAASTVPVRGYVSTAFHCPFEGKIAPERVAAVAHDLLGIGCAELSIGDTIGRATADEVRALLDALLLFVPDSMLAMHFHDTFGQATGNARVAADMGVRIFDASAGGLGGCPYAPGAPGNVATQALVRLFGEERTGLDLAKIEAAAETIRPYVGKAVG